MSASPTPYDSFAYRGFAYMETHPGRLATMAALYGMNPAPLARCRLLELGCGIGANVIPMAVQFPDSEFVGIDLSARSIEVGSSLIATLGLNNITLRHASIADVTADYGLFDYIVAHGVYSWVPGDVRDKILAIFGDNLAPQGVAYVSYNSQPGSHLRDMVRDMMLFHVRDIADPRERVEQARAVVKALSDAADKNSIHGVVLREQLGRIERMGNDSLFHDDLDAAAVPFLLHQVVADAERHGLQYLCDASLERRSLERLPDSMKALLSQFSGSAFMARDQYHDFIDGHAFRRTLLCRRDIRLDRDVKPESLKRFHLASSLTPTTPDVDPAAAGIVEFKTKAGDTLATNHLLTKAALLQLGQSWPAAVSYADLLEAARARLAGRAGMSYAGSDRAVEAAASALFDAVCGGHIELQLFPPSYATTLSERPKVSRLARMQLGNGAMVTTLRHETVMVEEEIMREFVQLVDGTRNIDQLAADFGAIVAKSQQPAFAGKVVTRDVVAHNLKGLARLALLTG